MRLVHAHCLAVAPEEAVGLIFLRPDGLAAVHPLRNTSPTPRRAFLVDPREWMAVETAALELGWRPIALYHSHPDAPATLSPVDLAHLCPGGVPVLGGLEVWVLSVRGGAVVDQRAYRWADGGYLPQQIQEFEAIESGLFR